MKTARPLAGHLRRPGWNSKICCLRSSLLGQLVLRWECISLAASFTCIQLGLLCLNAHLKVLKDYDRAFLAKAAFRFPPNSGLRGPNPEETEFADRQLWHEIGDLLEQGWSLDKAVHEVVHVRASLATLLQPRPALPAGAPHHPRGQRVRQDDRKGDDRHKGKGRGKSTGKGKGPSGKQAPRPLLGNLP